MGSGGRHLAEQGQFTAICASMETDHETLSLLFVIVAIAIVGLSCCSRGKGADAGASLARVLPRRCSVLPAVAPGRATTVAATLFLLPVCSWRCSPVIGPALAAPDIPV